MTTPFAVTPEILFLVFVALVFFRLFFFPLIIMLGLFGVWWWWHDEDAMLPSWLQSQPEESAE